MEKIIDKYLYIFLTPVLDALRPNLNFSSLNRLRGFMHRHQSPETPRYTCDQSFPGINFREPLNYVSMSSREVLASRRRCAHREIFSKYY